MKLLGIAVVLGLLAGVSAQISAVELLCDSAEAEEAALAAQDFLNAKHAHGYKYALNRIEDIKAYTQVNGETSFYLELDLLETDCHVLDPTPVANCTVRPKVLTAIEGDCDVVVKRVGGVMTVTGVSCKTEESTEDLCLGCPTLLPLNDTTALDFVHASLVTVNNMTENMTFTLIEVGRMSSQVVSGGPVYIVEYVVAEANCTDGPCVPLNDNMATRGVCTARGLSNKHSVNCKIFPTVLPVVDVNSTLAHAIPVVHMHNGSISSRHGLRHHKLTVFHEPLDSSLFSNESLESPEVFPAAKHQAVFFPVEAEPFVTNTSESLSGSEVRAPDVPTAAAIVGDVPVIQSKPIVLVPRCPGRVRFF